MKIVLSKLNGRYGFSIEVGGKEIFSTFEHAFIVPSIKYDYKCAHHAYRDARNMPMYHVASFIKKAFTDMGDELVYIDISAEEMLLDHYISTVDDLREEAEGVEDDNEEQRNLIYQKIKLITSELLSIKNKIEDESDKEKIDKELISELRAITNQYFEDLLAKDKAEKDEAQDAAADVEEPTLKDQALQEETGPQGMSPEQGLAPPPPMPMASGYYWKKYAKDNMVSFDDLMKDLLEEYGERACNALMAKHPSCVYDIDDNKIIVSDMEGDQKDKILEISVNDDYMVYNIMPCGKVKEIYPVDSVGFYQKYWKPVVEKIGHVLVDHLNTLIVPNASLLPDVPVVTPQSYCLDCLDLQNQSKKTIDVSFRGKDNVIWLLKESKPINASSEDKSIKYAEQKYIGKIVRCNNPELESINGRTGEVKGEVIDQATDIVKELDVDFGRGIDLVRVVLEDVSIVNI